MQHATWYWTVAFSEPASSDLSVAVVAAHDRADAIRRATDVLGDDVAIVWAEPRPNAAQPLART